MTLRVHCNDLWTRTFPIFNIYVSLFQSLEWSLKIHSGHTMKPKLTATLTLKIATLTLKIATLTLKTTATLTLKIASLTLKIHWKIHKFRERNDFQQKWSTRKRSTDFKLLRESTIVTITATVLRCFHTLQHGGFVQPRCVDGLTKHTLLVNNNIRLLETTDKPQSLDNNVDICINVYDGQSPPRQLRVSSLPTAVTRWGDKVSTQLSRPGFDLGCLDPKSSALPTAPSCLLFVWCLTVQQA